MAGSSIRCTDGQRRKIILLKMKLQEILGFEPRDKELVDLFFKAYEEKYPFFLAERLERIVEELKKVAIDVSDYENLKQENEELRKAVEKLKEEIRELKVKRVEVEDNSLSLDNIVNILISKYAEKLEDVKSTTTLFDDKEIEGMYKALEWLKEEMKNPTTFLLKIYENFIKDENVEIRQYSEANIRYGGRIW